MAREQDLTENYLFSLLFPHPILLRSYISRPDVSAAAVDAIRMCRGLSTQPRAELCLYLHRSIRETDQRSIFL